MRFGKAKEKKEDELDEDLDAAETAGHEEEPSQMPLMTGMGRPEGIDGDLDYSSMGEGSKVFNKGTMLIVIVTLVAAAALYGMRLSQSDNVKNDQAKKAEARIEEAITSLKASGNAKDKVDLLMNDASFIIAQLDVDPSKRQVPVEMTKKNPFYLFIDAPATGGPAKIEPDAEAKRLAEQMKKLEAEVARFKIQSILPNGRKPVAIIDNKIVQVGEPIGSFKVKEIQKLAVVLEAENGTEFTLSIENDPNKAEIKGVKGK